MGDTIFSMRHCPMSVRGKDVYNDGELVGSFEYEFNDILFDAIVYTDASGHYAGSLVGFKGADASSADFRDRDGHLSDLRVSHLTVYDGLEQVGRFKTLARAGAWIAFFSGSTSYGDDEASRSIADDAYEGVSIGYRWVSLKEIIATERAKASLKEKEALGSIARSRMPGGEVAELAKRVKSGELDAAEAAAEAIKSVKGYRTLLKEMPKSGLLERELKRDFGPRGEEAAKKALALMKTPLIDRIAASAGARGASAMALSAAIRAALVVLITCITASALSWSRGFDGGIAGSSARLLASALRAFAPAVCAVLLGIWAGSAIGKRLAAKAGGSKEIAIASQLIAGGFCGGVVMMAVDFMIRALQ